MKLKLIPLLLFCSFQLEAQDIPAPNKHYFRFAVSNSHTAKPLGSFLSLMYKEVHPGVEISRGKILQKKRNHQWLTELTLAYLYHRWVQHNLSLSVNGGYRRQFGNNWGATAKLGAGYQLSMPTGKVYSITDNGLEEKGHIVRSQLIAAISVGADKKISKRGLKVFIDYQQKVQAPFINEYVPLLPYNTLLIGVSIPVH